MKNLIITPGEINSSVTISGSKSYGNRALILASLNSEKTHIKSLPEAQDFWDLVSILRKLNVKIEATNEGLLVSGPFPECYGKQEKCILNLGQGGTTARFLLPFLALSDCEFQIELHPDLGQRPFLVLLESLQNLGVSIEPTGKSLFPLKLKGPMEKGRTVVVDSTQTSQFASALELVSEKAGLKVNPQNMQSSLKYFEMTKKLKKMERDFELPVDFSALSFPLFFALHNHGLEIPNCFAWDHLQGECEFFEFLMESNSIMAFDPHLKIEPTQYDDDFNIDVSQSLDLVPPLLYFLSYVPGEHKILNTRNLIFKESNRIDELKKLLSLFKRELRISVDQNEIHLTGKNVRLDESVKFTCPNDHRIVMTAYLFLKHNSGGELINTQPVEKSFQNFFIKMGEN